MAELITKNHFEELAKRVGENSGALATAITEAVSEIEGMFPISGDDIAGGAVGAFPKIF